MNYGHSFILTTRPICCIDLCSSTALDEHSLWRNYRRYGEYCLFISYKYSIDYNKRKLFGQ